MLIGFGRQIEDALGRKTTNTYDGLNDELTTSDPLGVRTTMAYDGHGNLLKRSRPLVGTSQTVTTSYAYGDSFSAESGYFFPTPSISQQMMDVSAGTSKPAIFAIAGSRCSGLRSPDSAYRNA